MFTIGEIVAVHGLRGDVRVHPHTDFPERFADLRHIQLTMPDGARRKFDLRRALSHETKSQVILGLAGIDSREAAKGLIGGIIEIEDSEAVELPEGTYFEHDILGLEVVTTDGRDLGAITDILRTGANDVYVTPDCLVPAISDVLREIDLEAGRIVIEAIPGLLEE